MRTATAVIAGEHEESVAFIKRLLSGRGFNNISYCASLEQLTADCFTVPGLLLVNVALLNDTVLPGHVKSLYPDIPVIVLCERDELLFALEAVGSKVDHYLVRDAVTEERIESAITFAACRRTRPEAYAECVKWFHSLIPRAILDIAGLQFLVDYENPENQANSQVKKAMHSVFEDLDSEIAWRLKNI